MFLREVTRTPEFFLLANFWIRTKPQEWDDSTRRTGAKQVYYSVGKKLRSPDIKGFANILQVGSGWISKIFLHTSTFLFNSLY